MRGVTNENDNVAARLAARRTHGWPPPTASSRARPSPARSEDRRCEARRAKPSMLDECFRPIADGSCHAPWARASLERVKFEALLFAFAGRVRVVFGAQRDDAGGARDVGVGRIFAHEHDVARADAIDAPVDF